MGEEGERKGQSGLPASSFTSSGVIMFLFVQERGQKQAPGASRQQFKPLTSCVTLGTLLHVSVVQLPPP